VGVPLGQRAGRPAPLGGPAGPPAGCNRARAGSLARPICLDVCSGRWPADSSPSS
jgi:hypothetical protein